MRRIIERVVTVVTTTTWTIYWKDDPPPVPGADPGMENKAWLLPADEAQHLPESEETSTTKEADGLEKGTPKIS